jgi:hypothetical protein
MTSGFSGFHSGPRWLLLEIQKFANQYEPATVIVGEQVPVQFVKMPNWMKVQ